MLARHALVAHAAILEPVPRARWSTPTAVRPGRVRRMRACYRHPARARARTPSASSSQTTSCAAARRCSSGCSSRSLTSSRWACSASPRSRSCSSYGWRCCSSVGRPALHRFLASYVRYSAHLTAYLTLAASPYPGFSAPARIRSTSRSTRPQGRAGSAPASGCFSLFRPLCSRRRWAAPPRSAPGHRSLSCWGRRPGERRRPPRLVRLPGPRPDASRHARRRGVHDRVRSADGGVRVPPHRSVPRRHPGPGGTAARAPRASGRDQRP